MKLYISFLLLVVVLSYFPECYSQLPEITQRDVIPGDSRLCDPINKSNEDELTIASFNIRNLGARKRYFSNYMDIVKSVEGADIVVFQEVGLGIFDKDISNETEQPEFKAIIALFDVAFGEEWDLCIPPNPTGVGNAREINVVAYKRNCNGFTCDVLWNSYIDLGDNRDMSLFNVLLKKGSRRNTIKLGSVHLKPDDPYRGEEMIKLADWFVQNNDKLLVLGDFNWGYQRVKEVENYQGEAKILDLHEAGELFQVFYNLSYLGKARGNKLRTNMGFRKSGYFYDQIILSPDLAAKMSDDGEFLSDCGIYAFDLKPAFEDNYSYINKQRNKALDKYLSMAGLPTDQQEKIMLEKTYDSILYGSKAYATYFLSDHRIVWVQLDLFGN